MNEYIKLAKNSIKNYIKTGQRMKVPENLPEHFYSEKKGVFITIYEMNPKKKLRGCVGTFLPTRDCIAEEIIDNAISAATYDNRFEAIRGNELKNLQYEVSLLNTSEQIASIHDLDVKKFGVIVKSKDGRTGLLLPDLEGVKMPEHQISIACQKAGINLENEEIELYRFTIMKY
ncbi:MAG: AmmeMemoRadiSam system protein A [Candidatus Pacebacteria bacterium]|nr:AmmeMemoRadiSam system protein A [Candidatus Paceibacterota bacterium]